MRRRGSRNPCRWPRPTPNTRRCCGPDAPYGRRLPPGRVQIEAQVLRVAAGPDARADDLTLLRVTLSDDAMHIVRAPSAYLKRGVGLQMGQLRGERRDPRAGKVD